MAFSAFVGLHWRTKPGHVVLAVAGATDLVLGLRSEGFARSTWRWRGSWKLGNGNKLKWRSYPPTPWWTLLWELVLHGNIGIFITTCR